MPANKKPRKAYRPKNADSLATHKAVAKCTGLTVAEHKAVTSPVEVSWYRLQNGIANASDIDVFADVIATCIVAAQDMGQYLIDVCNEASNALAGILDRYARCGKWGVDAATLRVFPSIIEYYDELTGKGTASNIAEWYGEAMKVKAKVYAEVAV